MVELFIEWLHERSDHPMIQDLWSARFQTLIKLYIFADKYDVPCFRSSLFRKMELVPRINMRPSLTAIELAYDNLPASSELPRLLIGSYAVVFHKMSKVKAEECKKKISQRPECAVDLVCALADLTQSEGEELPDFDSPIWALTNACRYSYNQLY